MKIPLKRNGIHEDPEKDLRSGLVKIQEDRAAELPRSTPLKSSYNATFIILVLSIAALLALILVFWPSSGF